MIGSRQIRGASWATVKTLAFTLSRGAFEEFQGEGQHDLIEVGLKELFWLLS